METTQTVQELKAERVQEEIALVTEEPFRLSLKSERVQEPAAVVVGPTTQRAAAVALSLQLSRHQPVTIALTEGETIITI